MGKRNMQVLYYEDAFGNQHHNGTMEVATTYVLLEDGQEISYADPGLPSDFSRNYTGPERGAFKAVSLSASASTVFLINEAGEMYTRIADFDITGGDPMFFKYTYAPYTSDLAGANYFSNLTEWALPPEDWRPQPRIPLTGKAAITRHITILQNGQGNGARELRVAGLNEQGETGYWTKAIFADSWEFNAAPLYFREGVLLTAGESDDIRGERGTSPDKRFSGYWWNNNEKEYGFAYEISNFNILEGDCDLRITWHAETCTLKLHPVELWTYLKRDYLPGRDGPPKLFFATVDIPVDTFIGLSEEFARHVREKFAKNDKAHFQYTIAASARYIFMREKNTTDSVLFLTDGILSDYFPEFRHTWYIENYDEILRYQSDELEFVNTIFTNEQYDELCQKIEKNKAFRQELKARINGLRKNKLSALELDMLYIPLHYIARFSPLRFIDAPKIRTMTNYGEEIVLANSAYTDIISDTRIFVDKKIIELLDARILCYKDMAKKFKKTKEPVLVPRHFSETITGYWDIAGLPHKVAGEFSDLSLSPPEKIPAVLTFAKDKNGQEYFCWYLACSGSTVEENNSLLFFLDPRKSAKAIYSRGGKTPTQNTVQLDCTLYINIATDRDIFRGMDVRITFDGDTLEIREHPATHGNTLIFRGQRVPE
jgi:hypothetical protein